MRMWAAILGGACGFVLTTLSLAVHGGGILLGAGVFWLLASFWMRPGR